MNRVHHPWTPAAIDLQGTDHDSRRHQRGATTNDTQPGPGIQTVPIPGTVPLITETRIRAAIDRVARHQFDAAGARIENAVATIRATRQAVMPGMPAIRPATSG